MMKLPNLAGFEGLIDLDRRGVDIRPTLLRVLTDQYLHRRIHTPDEERQYTELTLRLLDETDVPARAAVATRLATHANAPRAVILRLARDVLTVARCIHALLEPIGAPHFIKTSGQDGLHVLIPLAGALTHEEAKSFAEVLARLVAAGLEGRVLAVRVTLQRMLGALVAISVRRTHESGSSEMRQSRFSTRLPRERPR